jgi:hypothetical protein
MPMPDDQADLDARAQAEAAQMALESRLKAITGRLEKEAEERVGRRYHIEQRWIEDIEQYHGKYDETTLKQLKDNQASSVFVNLTRPKTDAMAARLEDLLFPTDDRNWGIGPTPVPELSEDAEAAVMQAEELREEAEAAEAQMAAGPEGEAPDPAMMEEAKALAARAEAAKQYSESLEARIEEARARSKGMQLQIEDYLKESAYHAVARDQIMMACLLGTGVIKGPVTGDKVRAGWKQQSKTDEMGKPVIGPTGEPELEFVLAENAGNRPGMRLVDLWNWFPDMDARDVSECDSFYERHLLNKKGLRNLAKLPDFDKDAIRRLLKLKPQASAPSYLVNMRSITGQQTEMTSDRYHVWEYTGSLSAEDMRDLATAMGDEATLADIEEADPLDEMQVIIWFCQGEVLRFSIYPYDSGEPLYSVFNLVKDFGSIFGFGVPWMMRNPQRALNAAWRMMMDNAALSTGDQILIDRKQVEPDDGNWRLTPRKIWNIVDGVPKDSLVFQTFSIPMHQAELANIIALSQKHIDDETAIPQLAQGEQGSHITKTAQGMSILMNASNIVFRRIVKSYDDDVTVPTIRRFYDWEMQFGENPDIKGDYEIDARGSSVLLVREMQSQNLFALLMNFSAHPIFGPMMKNADGLRMLMQSFMIPASELVLTDAEIERVQKQAQLAAAEQGGKEAEMMAEMKGKELELREMEIAAKIEIANMERATKLEMAQMQRETQMMKMAEAMNMGIDKIEAQLQDNREERARKERQMAVEAAVTERAGPTGGGLF